MEMFERVLTRHCNSTMDDLGSQFKGYTQVTEFEPDVDGEYEEEEVSGSYDTDTDS